MSLWSEYLANSYAHAAFKGSHYFQAYERHLSRFRDLSVTMVEIGVFRGGSLEMWKRYLGPSAQIVGIDIDPKCKAFEEPQIAVRIGDQGDRAFMQAVVDEFGEIDIVLDDGSHRGPDIAASFEVIYPQMSRNGVYIVEDAATSYLEGFGGGLKRPGTFIETVKDRIDELHAIYSPDVEATPFSETTTSLHVYPNLVAFERGRHVDRRGILTVADEKRREGKSPI